MIALLLIASDESSIRVHLNGEARIVSIKIFDDLQIVSPELRLNLPQFLQAVEKNIYYLSFVQNAPLFCIVVLMVKS